MSGLSIKEIEMNREIFYYDNSENSRSLQSLLDELDSHVVSFHTETENFLRD